jgi:hypothetical protein
MEERVRSDTEERYLACARVISGGEASLIVFLLVCSSMLSLLPINEDRFEKLEDLWRVSYFLLGLALAGSQFLVFQEKECESVMELWPKILLTVSCLGCFLIAVMVRESKVLGGAFLLTALALGTILTVSILSNSFELSIYGYFSHIVCLIGLVVIGARMILELRVFEALKQLQQM